MDTLFAAPDIVSAWATFRAAGYDVPVCGAVYDAAHPATNGLPLGGLDTGCIDYETNGLFGYATIFNSLSPRRGPLYVPPLGLKIGARAYLLSAVSVGPARGADRCWYWGHYPIADLELEYDGAPFSAGVRAWSPFVPGDAAASMIPAAIFEIRLRNHGPQPLPATLAISFPGCTMPEASGSAFARVPLSCPGFSGAECHAAAGVFAGDRRLERVPDRPAFALGFLDERPTRYDRACDLDAGAWARIDAPQQPVIALDNENSGLRVATDVLLPAGGEEVVRAALIWHAPVWFGNGTPPAGGKRYRHMYARHLPTLRGAVEHVARHHEALLRRVIAWQTQVYADASLPGWLQDSLVNNLHLLTETSVWGQGHEGADGNDMPAWVDPERGLFALNECPRHCPQLECLPCSFYGNLPVVYFFPEAAASTLHGYRAYQREDGRPAWVFGGCTVGTGPYDLTSPGMGYQASLNGFCVVEMVHKLWKVAGDPQVLRDFYDLARRATDWTISLNPGPAGIISMPAAQQSEQGLAYETEWFEAPEPGWRGMAAHVGGVRLAQLQLMRDLALANGDQAYAARCAEWLAAGAAAMEQHLWQGDYYLNFYEPETGARSELVFGYQLDGQWVTRFHGVPDAFPPERVAQTLATIARCNVALSRTGATNYANHDGSPAAVGGYGPYSYFHAELLMLAMTYLYAGQREFGLELARRCWEAIACTHRYTWDMPNYARGDLDTGERGFGNDYYQLMMLWALPAALAGQDIAGPCQPGGLVQRIVAAGREQR